MDWKCASVAGARAPGRPEKIAASRLCRRIRVLRAADYRLRAVGWGRLSLQCDITATIFHAQLRPGRSAPTRSTSTRSSRASRSVSISFRASYRCRALAGLDTALWDLRGRLEGKPVVELLGGQPRTATYASSMRRDITPSRSRTAHAAARREGFDAVKWRVGRSAADMMNGPPDGGDRAAGWRALGDDVGNSWMRTALSPRRAIEVGRCWRRSISHIRGALPLLEARGNQARTDAPISTSLARTGLDLATWERMIACTPSTSSTRCHYMAGYRGHFKS